MTMRRPEKDTGCPSSGAARLMAFSQFIVSAKLAGH